MSQLDPNPVKLFPHDRIATIAHPENLSQSGSSSVTLMSQTTTELNVLKDKYLSLIQRYQQATDPTAKQTLMAQTRLLKKALDRRIEDSPYAKYPFDKLPYIDSITGKVAYARGPTSLNDDDQQLIQICGSNVEGISVSDYLKPPTDIEIALQDADDYEDYHEEEQDRVQPVLARAAKKSAPSIPSSSSSHKKSSKTTHRTSSSSSAAAPLKAEAKTKTKTAPSAGGKKTSRKGKVDARSVSSIDHFSAQQVGLEQKVDKGEQSSKGWVARTALALAQFGVSSLREAREHHGCPCYRHRD